MQAYKFLTKGRSVFTGHPWQGPEGESPGPWLEVEGELRLCVNGIHACAPAQLPLWLTDELFEFELSGQIIETEAALIASRARLVEAVEAWDRPARIDFAEDCASRARRREIRDESLPLRDRVVSWAPGGWAAAVGYWAAVLAGETEAGRRKGPEYDRAFSAERAVQAGWLAIKLGLTI